MKTAIYPGTFDPITNGHIDVIERACKLFDKVIVLLVDNPAKKTLFTKQERVQLIEESIYNHAQVRVDAYDGVTLDYAKKVNACAMVRGIRQVKDYEYELNNASCNAWIDASVETVLMFAKQEYSFVSSTSVKEFAMFHQNTHGLVSEAVERALVEKYHNQ